MVNCYKGKKLFRQGYARLLAVHVGLVLLMSAVVLGDDEYYKSLLRSGPTTRPVEDHGDKQLNGAEAGGRQPAFSFTAAVRAAAAANPVRFSSETTVAPIYPSLPQRDWQQRLPYAAFSWLALVVDVLVLCIFIKLPAAKPVIGSLRPLLVLLTACLLLWLVVKNALAFLAGGLTFSIMETALLGSYLTLMSTRCEVVLVFAMLLAETAVLYVVAEHFLRSVPAWRTLTALAIVPLATFPYAFVIWDHDSRISSGYLMGAVRLRRPPDHARRPQTG